MTTIVSITDFKKNASVILDAIDKGESFLIERRGNIVGTLENGVR